MASIFAGLVNSENDYTKLLLNLLGRHPRVAASVLSCLLGRDVSDIEAAMFDFHAQHSFLGSNGREIPDLLIEGRRLRCVVEVKIDSGLDLTEAQKGGYQACMLADGENHLCFLVPDDWKYAERVLEARQHLPPTVLVRKVSWLDVIKSLHNIEDDLVNEVILFLKESFDVEHLTSEERNSLIPWSAAKYLAIRKLEKTVDQARKIFAARGRGTEAETWSKEAYGFYVKRDGSYLVWVGIWAKCPTPLCFGYKSKSPAWLEPESSPPAAFTTDAHSLWPLEETLWDDPEQIFQTVDDFLLRYFKPHTLDDGR
jgi:hypothetical protein